MEWKSDCGLNIVSERDWIMFEVDKVDRKHLGSSGTEWK